MSERATAAWGIWNHGISSTASLNRFFYFVMDVYMKFRHFSEASGDFQLMRRDHWAKVECADESLVVFI